MNRWANVWILIDDLIKYSREIVWSIDELTFPFEFWTDIPAEFAWLSTWTVISERMNLINDLSRYSRAIDEPLFLSDRLNFDRWLELLFPRNYWTVIPERTFERWFEPIFPRNCWLERTFELWSSNPVTFVWLRNGRFPAYVLRDSVCFELSVHMYTYLRSRIWTIYFRNHAFVTWRSSGIWPMRFRSCDFVHVSDLSSWWNLRPSEASLLGEVVEFDLCASEVVTSYVFPTYLRVCFRINFRGETNCFRSFAFVHFPTPCFQINFVVLLRSCPCFERSRFALSRTSRILGKRTIAPH